MQVKKEEVKSSILLSGEKEFLEKGFEKASIRQIVKNAGTTIGNFYNYFDNKEALFTELIQEDLIKFRGFIDNHESYERPDFLWDMSNPKIWREVLGAFIKTIIPEFGKGLVLLLVSSEGTQYEESKYILINEVRDHFIEHLQEHGTNNVSISFAEVLAKQFVQGFVDILRNYEDEEKNELIVEHLLFYMIGAMGMIGDFQ